MKLRLPIAALAAAMATTIAYAQEPEPKHPGRDAAAVPGFRAELLGGYDDDGFSSGLLYGGRIGYDFKIGDRFLLGLDGEINDVDTHRTLDIGTQPPLRAKDGSEIYVGGRVTFALSSRFRLYGGAGYARLKQGVFVQTEVTPPPFGTFGVRRFTVDGYRLSAGAQFLLGKRAFLGAEYRGSIYQDFGSSHRDQLVGSLGIRF
ncbi:MAG TPA: outer membrane beta-barrel protein [Allosphingosinicella sp.]|jgi:opacity protein-like surface antigen